MTTPSLRHTGTSPALQYLLKHWDILKGASPSAVVPTEFFVHNAPPIHARLRRDPHYCCDSSRFHCGIETQRPGNPPHGTGTIAIRMSFRAPAGRCSGRRGSICIYMRPVSAHMAYKPIDTLAGRREGTEMARCCRLEHASVTCITKILTK